MAVDGKLPGFKGRKGRILRVKGVNNFRVRRENFTVRKGKI